jgi:hypothetical protein
MLNVQSVQTLPGLVSLCRSAQWLIRIVHKARQGQKLMRRPARSIPSKRLI